MTEKVGKMPEDNTKSHKIILIVKTNLEWGSHDVADTVQELLEMENDVEEPSFIEVDAMSDPTNEDVGLKESLEATIALIDLYSKSLESKLLENKILELFKNGLDMIKGGVVDVQACIRCADFFMNKTSPDIKVAKVGLEDLVHAPEEVIHAIAHTLGLEQGACKAMSKDDMINWIKDNIRGEPRTIN